VKATTTKAMRIGPTFAEERSFGQREIHQKILSSVKAGLETAFKIRRFREK